MMNFESDERNLPQKISEDIISFILNEHLQVTSFLMKHILLKNSILEEVLFVKP